MSARKFQHPDGEGVKRAHRSEAAMTPEEFTAWLAEVIPSDAYEIRISPGAFIEFYSPRTEEETERWRLAVESRDKRQAEWERVTYERLRAKFDLAEVLSD